MSLQDKNILKFWQIVLITVEKKKEWSFLYNATSYKLAAANQMNIIYKKKEKRTKVRNFYISPKNTIIKS